MRLHTAFIFLLVFSIPVAAQTSFPKAAKSVETIEDIEVGMSADPVIAGLTKQGYALKDVLKRPTGDLARWDVSFRDKFLGAFDVEKGRVTSAEVYVYTDHGGGSIELAEALYWILYDNGQTLPSKDRDLKQTVTDVHITTREIDYRTPGAPVRLIFVETASGARYRISLLRSPNEKPSVSLDKLTPFVKKK